MGRAEQKTSRPTWSARTISSGSLSIRWTALRVRPEAGLEITAPKLSILICIAGEMGVQQFPFSMSKRKSVMKRFRAR